MPFNSTIIVRKKPLKCGHRDYNFSKGRCKQCATIEDSLIRMNKEDESDDEFGELIKCCDGLFSKYIRLKYSDKKGEVKCFTCTTKKHWTLMQNGHYIPRANMFLRMDSRNCRPQCEYCNCHKSGNLLIFAQNLELEYTGITEILYEEAKTIYKYTREELRLLKIDLTNKIKKLKIINEKSNHTNNTL
jgi:hypothetical protein